MNMALRSAGRRQNDLEGMKALQVMGLNVAVVGPSHGMWAGKPAFGLGGHRGCRAHVRVHVWRWSGEAGMGMRWAPHGVHWAGRELSGLPVNWVWHWGRKCGGGGNAGVYAGKEGRECAGWQASQSIECYAAVTVG